MLENNLNHILKVCSNLSANHIPWKVIDGKAISLPPIESLKAIQWDEKTPEDKYDLIFVPHGLSNINWNKLKNYLLPHGKIYVILKDGSKRSLFIKHMNVNKVRLKDERINGDSIHYVFGIDQKFNKPKWNGERGATVLVHCGGGFGDEFHTIRYLNNLRKYCSKVIYQSRPETYKLFKKCSLYDEVIIKGQEIEYDFHVSEMSLNEKYGLGEFIPPYFSVKPHDLIVDDSKIKVGFVYKGNFVKYGAKRNFELNNFDIFKKNNIKLYCFQHESDFQKNKKITEFINLSDEINDWYDTAKYMAAMDVIMSADTGFAHLAALLGKKTLVFLRRGHDNVYMPIGHKCSPHYPKKMFMFWGETAFEQIYREIIPYKFI